MTLIAERIQARLKVLALTPRAASLKAGRQAFTVRDILSGKNENPKADLILDLAHALVCSTDYLLGLTDKPGAAPGLATIDPQLVAMLQRVPASELEVVKRMVEGVAKKSAAPKAKAGKRKT